MKIGRTIEIVKSVIIYIQNHKILFVVYDLVFQFSFFFFFYLLLHDDSQHLEVLRHREGPRCLIQSAGGTATSSIMVDFLYSNVNNNHSGDCYLNYRT